jgi:hypothetical protein
MPDTINVKQSTIGAGGTDFKSIDWLGKFFQGLVGATPFRRISAGSGDAASIKGSAGALMMLVVTNINASPRYLKLYDSASAPTPGSGTPKFTFMVPGATTGDGFVVPIPIQGIAFASGIGMILVTGSADADATAVAAGDMIVNAAYL